MLVTEARSTCSSIVDTCLAPYYFIAEKVRALAETIFGYFLRIVTFQLGEIRVSGASTVIRLYQKLVSCDPREERPYDPDRLQRSKDFLLDFCSTEDRTALPVDGGEGVHYCTFKSADFFEKFRQMGAQLVDINHEGRLRRAFLNVSPETATKFFFPVIDITLLDGTVQNGVLLPDACPSPNPPHLIDFHSPGRSMYMERQRIGQCLGAGYDLTVSDLRGTAESKGSPSEAGYYADADAILQEVLRIQNIPLNRIYASGYCEGAAVACYLKQKYHAQGLNYIACNPYTSMREVVESYGFWGRMAARYGAWALLGNIQGISEDCFDNEAKLRNLPRSTGKCIFIHTEPDPMMPRGSVSRMIEAFNHAGPVHEILRIHPNPQENGHLHPPLNDSFVWSRVVQVMT